MFFLLVAGCFSYAEISKSEPQEESLPEEKNLEGKLSSTKISARSSEPHSEQPQPSSRLVSKAIEPDSYHFLTEDIVTLVSLEERFPTPGGYKRVELSDDSFGLWLRGLPLKKDVSAVYSYKGEQLYAPAAAVVPMDLGRGDVQQCADSILRLYAEYKWNLGQADELGFHFTSGDLSTWKAWRKGERFRIKGSKVLRVNRKQVKNNHSEFRKWLQHTFLYAGTRSLKLDATKISDKESILPGDFFVTPGSPGHAIIVLDVAHSESGPPIALLGQGFMPAQDFHVLTDTGSHVIQHWFILPKTAAESLDNPSWSPIPRTSVLRFTK